MEQPTCGQGLAAHAPVPELLGEVMAATAEVLALHVAALDLDDLNAVEEHRAYEHLEREHRRIAADLRATSDAMRGYRDLPMARHKMEGLLSVQAVNAFRQFVQREQELADLLQARLAQDRELLGAMEAASGQGLEEG